MRSYEQGVRQRAEPGVHQVTREAANNTGWGSRLRVVSIATPNILKLDRLRTF